jgi:hypothetical protein
MLVQLTGSADVQNWVPEPGCGMKILDCDRGVPPLPIELVGTATRTRSAMPEYAAVLQHWQYYAVAIPTRNVALCLSPSTQDVQWNALVEDTNRMV